MTNTTTAAQTLHQIAEPAIVLTEQDAVLLNQAIEMLEEHSAEQRRRGNCSAAEGAECSAHAVQRLGVAMLAAQRQQPPTDTDTLARTETTARYLLGWKYGQMPTSPDTLLRQSDHAKAQWAWNAACKLLRFIDGSAPAEVPAVATEPMGQAAPGTQAIEPAATVAPQLADVPEWGELAKRIDEGGALTPLEQFIHDNEEAGPGADAWRKSVVDMVQHYAAPAVPAPAADAATPVGFALVPLRMTRAMDEVLQQEGWQWEDLLAAAKAVTEEQYEAIARDWLSRDAFTHAELLELRRAADEFADGIDTDVDHDLLARGAIANYLYCERFTVMDTDALDSAIAAQEALQ